ncbi:radical SAM enzyme [Dendrothele bispora CBS 962.96]|uniref:Radical SAM enzyme n=1 Tax=Dendrothele bispora (strain CBS 962.96) TaxID=1314807 RepID=A0A4S8MIB0_DENBC|nr:radical SAM enzyme [Dendrothele bispora CBS 962.96]
MDAETCRNADRKLCVAKIDAIDKSRPFSRALIDTYKRRHHYLRISLTKRCNLRCFYCMPEQGVKLTPDGKILTDEEVIRLATLFVQAGVTSKIRLMGGEPTVRKGIIEIIQELNKLRPLGLKSIAMTSNGLVLHRRLPSLIGNGLTHLNPSLDTLDTLDPFKFEFMTKRRGHEAVLKALDVALASPDLQSVKLNVVVVKGLNDSEILDFVEMTKNSAISVCFMPFTGNKWDKVKMVPSSVSKEMGHCLRMATHHPDVVRISDEANDTVWSWKVPDCRGVFGFISSMADHFCSSCNHLRITADGQIKLKKNPLIFCRTSLTFWKQEVSLRDEMRKGASDSDLLRIIGHAVSGKQEKHVHMEDINVVTNRPMILIGG